MVFMYSPLVFLCQQVCKFEMGSYSYHTKYMKFITVLDYTHDYMKAVLDYDLDIKPLKEDDLEWFGSGTGYNYSMAGFEMTFRRHGMKYIVDYYLTSGLFVVISWVGFKFIVAFRSFRLKNKRLNLNISNFFVYIGQFSHRA